MTHTLVRKIKVVITDGSTEKLRLEEEVVALCLHVAWQRAATNEKQHEGARLSDPSAKFLRGRQQLLNSLSANRIFQMKSS